MYRIVLNLNNKKFTSNKIFHKIEEAKDYMKFLSINKNCNYEIFKLNPPKLKEFER